MYAVNHVTKQILIYKLQAMCGASTCCYPDCRAPNTGGRTCDEHGEYKVHVWWENGGYVQCEHCGVWAVRNGHCVLCLKVPVQLGDHTVQ